MSSPNALIQNIQDIYIAPPLIHVGTIPLVDVVLEDIAASLLPGNFSKTPSGLLSSMDSEGLFIQGGYSVRLYVNVSALPELDDLDPGLDLDDILGPQPMGHGSPVPCTNPLETDTDEDGLEDMEETSGSKNPYKSDRHDPSGPGGNTDPCSADTDGDTIRDGLEVGIKRNGASLSNAWVMNPNREDTDGDSLSDGREDGRGDGINDLSFDSFSGRYKSSNNGLSSPVDADTDDDGVRDDVEIVDPRLNPLTWDSDGDGLSDGLETGVTSRVFVGGVTHTETKNVFDLSDWPTSRVIRTMVG